MAWDWLDDVFLLSCMEEDIRASEAAKYKKKVEPKPATVEIDDDDYEEFILSLMGLTGDDFDDDDMELIRSMFDIDEDI